MNLGNDTFLETIGTSGNAERCTKQRVLVIRGSKVFAYFYSNDGAEVSVIYNAFVETCKMANARPLVAWLV